MHAVERGCDREERVRAQPGRKVPVQPQPALLRVTQRPGQVRRRGVALPSVRPQLTSPAVLLRVTQRPAQPGAAENVRGLHHGARCAAEDLRVRRLL